MRSSTCATALYVTPVRMTGDTDAIRAAAGPRAHLAHALAEEDVPSAERPPHGGRRGGRGRRRGGLHGAQHGGARGGRLALGPAPPQRTVARTERAEPHAVRVAARHQLRRLQDLQRAHLPTPRQVSRVRHAPGRRRREAQNITCFATVVRSNSIGASVVLARRQRTKCGRACTSVRSRLSSRVWKSCVRVVCGASSSAAATVGDARNCAPDGPPCAASACGSTRWRQTSRPCRCGRRPAAGPLTFNSAPKRWVAKPNSQVRVSKAASSSSGTASRFASRKSAASYTTSPQ